MERRGRNILLKKKKRHSRAKTPETLEHISLCLLFASTSLVELSLIQNEAVTKNNVNSYTAFHLQQEIKNIVYKSDSYPRENQEG